MVEGRTAAHQRSTVLTPRHTVLRTVDGVLAVGHVALNSVSRSLAPGSETSSVFVPRISSAASPAYRCGQYQSSKVSPKAILSRSYQRLADQARQSRVSRMAAHWSSQDTQTEIKGFRARPGTS